MLYVWYGVECDFFVKKKIMLEKCCIFWYGVFGCDFFVGKEIILLEESWIFWYESDFISLWFVVLLLLLELMFEVVELCLWMVVFVVLVMDISRLELWGYLYVSLCWSDFMLWLWVMFLEVIVVENVMLWWFMGIVIGVKDELLLL